MSPRLVLVHRPWLRVAKNRSPVLIWLLIRSRSVLTWRVSAMVDMINNSFCHEWVVSWGLVSCQSVSSAQAAGQEEEEGRVVLVYEGTGPRRCWVLSAPPNSDRTSSQLHTLLQISAPMWSHLQKKVICCYSSNAIASSEDFPELSVFWCCRVMPKKIQIVCQDFKYFAKSSFCPFSTFEIFCLVISVFKCRVKCVHINTQLDTY